MTENLQADLVQRRQPFFVRCRLEFITDYYFVIFARFYAKRKILIQALDKYAEM